MSSATRLYVLTATACGAEVWPHPELCRQRGEAHAHAVLLFTLILACGFVVFALISCADGHYGRAFLLALGGALTPILARAPMRWCREARPTALIIEAVGRASLGGKVFLAAGAARSLCVESRYIPQQYGEDACTTHSVVARLREGGGVRLPYPNGYAQWVNSFDDRESAVVYSRQLASILGVPVDESEAPPTA